VAGQDADDLIADLIDLGGAGLQAVELVDGASVPETALGAVRVGVHRSGPLPALDPDGFDILLSADPNAPAPWVSVPDVDAELTHLNAMARQQPTAASVAAQVFRMGPALAFEQALALESVAYSMLLASRGFRAWRFANPPRAKPAQDSGRLGFNPVGSPIHILLTRSGTRNAFDARMRDELCDAFAFALDHPDRPPVVLSGSGPCFSAGGDLDEFGSAEDVGLAHLIRSLRSPAALAHRLGPRLTVRLHGACVGAGIEVPAAAGRTVALAGAFFRLPEVSMGLIPGAGGTASIPRRVGRHRAAYMAISGRDIDLPTALAWGLVDEVEA
jgi:Enoyl-CoA hydratase/isomerase